jgi:3',5'-cyclic AMP phosphodiesterase CpdA
VITVVQVSDVHIGSSPQDDQRAARLFARLADLTRPVDAVLITGDITDQGAPEDYEKAASLISTLPYPVFTCPGNHDERAAYARILLGEERPPGPVNQVRRAGGAVFALCDSTIPGEPGGRLADDTLEWLDRELGEAPAGAPVFVCFHHPPAVLHIPFLDGMRQTGGERLAEVLGRHGNVAAILAGHAHTPSATTFAGLPLLICPAVISTSVLPWEGDGVIDHAAPPAFAFHILDDQRRLTTHFRVVP